MKIMRLEKQSSDQVERDLTKAIQTVYTRFGPNLGAFVRSVQEADRNKATVNANNRKRPLLPAECLR